MNELLRQLAANNLAAFILVLARVTPLFFLAPLAARGARERGRSRVTGLAPVAATIWYLTFGSGARIGEC